MKNQLFRIFMVKSKPYSIILSLIEKNITLEDVSLIDFLGAENRNMNELSVAFPRSKIISRGNVILIRGDAADVHQIADILNALLEHVNQFGRVTPENVRGYIAQERTEFYRMMPPMACCCTAPGAIR